MKPTATGFFDVDMACLSLPVEISGRRASDQMLAGKA